MLNAAPQNHRKLCNEEYAQALVDRLLRLAIESDPAGGSKTECAKDLRAFDALHTAGELTSALAGWAIHHATSLAKNNLEFVPLQPNQTKKHPDYLTARFAADRHEHENAGTFPTDGDDRRLVWKLLINLLRANSGGWPWGLVHHVIGALESLEFGEKPELFEPISKGGHKRGWSELHAQLKAICFVEYRRHLSQMSKLNAIKIVSDAFGVSIETVTSWEKRLRDELGKLQVSRSIALAQNAARNKRSTGDLLYGDAALNECALKYKALLKRKKLHSS
jgi:hypothetical protein